MSLVPQSFYKNIFSNAQQPVLQKAAKPMLGPGRIPLDVLGFARLLLKTGAKQIMPKVYIEKVYVVKNLSRPLLGLPAIVALGLLIRVNSIDMATLNSSYPKLCNGLLTVKQPYAIKLNQGAIPYSLKNPVRIPLPLMGKIKEELQHMEVNQVFFGHRTLLPFFL